MQPGQRGRMHTADRSAAGEESAIARLLRAAGRLPQATRARSGKDAAPGARPQLSLSHTCTLTHTHTAGMAGPREPPRRAAAPPTAEAGAAHTPAVCEAA